MPKVKENAIAYKTSKTTPKVVSAKQSALAMLKRLRDDVTYEDIMYELYVLEKIEKGLRQIEQGKTVSHEEVKRCLARWLR